MFDGTASPTEESLLAELADLSTGYAPRRFALCVVDVERDDGVVLGWGLALPDEALAYLHHAATPTAGILRAPSATCFPPMLSSVGDVKLWWIDAVEPDL